MKTSNPLPPKWIGKLLHRLCKPELMEEIEGDLLEFYRDWLTRYSPSKANRLFVLHAIKFLRPFALKSPFQTSSLNQNFMLKTHFKTARRQLIKNKGYSFLNIAGLSLGMVVVLLIALWTHDELSFNKHHENYDRLARVMQNQTFSGGEIQTWRGQALQLAPELRTTYGDHFEHISMASFQGENTLFHKLKALKQRGIFMESTAPEMLTLEMIHGTRKGLAELNSILISESCSKAFFGNEDPINKVIRIDDMPDVKVTGVYMDLPANSTFAEVNYIGSWELFATTLPEWLNWGNSWFQTIVQIGEHKEMEEVSKAIKNVKLNRISEESGLRFKPELFLHPMSKWHLYSSFKQGQNTGGRVQYVWIFAIVAGFVLILACINFMNLTTARSEKRAKEVGVRKAIGSGRKQLMSQFFIESFMVVVIAFIIGLAITLIILPAFNDLTGKQVQVLWSSPIFWTLCVSSILLTGLVAGSYPALYLSSFNAVRALKGAFNFNRSTVLPRKVLVTVQFTSSIVFIIGTLVVLRQVEFVKNRPIGYEKDQLITVPLKSEEIRNKFEVFRNDLLQNGLAKEVSRSSTSIAQTFVTNSGMSWEGKDPDMQDEFVTVRINHEFGESVGWNVIKGRDFSRAYSTDSAGFVINKTAAEYMGLQDPVGQKVRWGVHGTYTILGVVDDMISQSPYEPVKQTIFFLNYKGPGRTNLANIKLTGVAGPKESIAVIEQIYKKYDDVNIFEYDFVDEQYAEKFESEERVGKLITSFAVLAILISCLGLFGMSYFVVQRRQKEIGVRKVLGASVISLWKILSKEFVVLVLLSSFIASSLAYYFASNWLQQFEYRTTLSMWIFVTAAIGALFIAISTVSYNTIKAAILSPVRTIRTE
ncbi:MAG: FtsX-like permease family protein [Bacteroidota bacterium]